MSKKPTPHPPIPPNCEDILEEIDDVWFLKEGNCVTDLETVLAHYLEQKNRYSGVALRAKRAFKELICRCRCAWLDKMRCDPPNDFAGSIGGDKLLPTEIRQCWLNHCERLSEEWRNWAWRSRMGGKVSKDFMAQNFAADPTPPTIPCHSCKKQILKDTVTCPHCAFIQPDKDGWTVETWRAFYEAVKPFMEGTHPAIVKK